MLFRGLNKKGQVQTEGWVQVVGYILAAIVVLGILGIVASFATMYFREKEEEYAINNFITLANKIETLSKSREKFDVQRAFPFYLPSNFVVVGFNYEWDDNEVTDGCEPEAVRKPYHIDRQEGIKCEDSACLCLFTNNDDFMDGSNYNVKLMECRSLPQIDYIVIPYLKEGKGKEYKYPSGIHKNFIGEKIPLGDYSSIEFDDYAFSYIYGECDDYYWDTNLQSRKLYIEKFSANNNTYIFITPEHEGSDFANERYSAMNEKYRKPS